MGVTVEEARGKHEDRVIEEGGVALLDRFHPLDEVGELRGVKLICLEIHRLLVDGLAVVGEVEVQSTLHTFEELEVHLRKIVIEHQCGDAALVHLEREHGQIEHELHVIGDVLR